MELERGEELRKAEILENFLYRVRQMESEIKRLKSENAEFRTRLDNAVELPCKIGDKVYWYDSIDGENSILDGIVANFNIDNAQGELWMLVRYSDGLNYHHKVNAYFGKTVFLTREEAEKALKGGDCVCGLKK